MPESTFNPVFALAHFTCEAGAKGHAPHGFFAPAFFAPGTTPRWGAAAGVPTPGLAGDGAGLQDQETRRRWE